MFPGFGPVFPEPLRATILSWIHKFQKKILKKRICLAKLNHLDVRIANNTIHVLENSSAPPQNGI